MDGKQEQGSARSQMGGAPKSAATEAQPSAAGRTIHVVTGQTGEYSDRSEWLTRAFEVEADARALVEFLTAKRQQLGYPPGDWDGRDAIESEMRAFDPGFQEDYTGTSWFVQPVELSPSKATGEQP